MNTQREKFQKEVSGHIKSGAGGHMGGSGSEHEGMTRIEHHEDGTHTVHHADGEKSGPHASMAHAAMHLTGKHDGGEHGHIMPHGAGATTHHIGMDGEVQGPHDHGSEEEAYNHLKGSIGEGAESGGEESGPAYVSGQGEDSSSFE